MTPDGFTRAVSVVCLVLSALIGLASALLWLIWRTLADILAHQRAALKTHEAIAVSFHKMMVLMHEGPPKQMRAMRPVPDGEGVDDR